MASAQLGSLVRLYKTRPTGEKTLIMQGRVEQLAPAGGAPDGAPASVSTPEKLMTVNSGVTLVNDDFLEVAVILDTADGVDASDCIWSIPLVTPAGTKTLGNTQFANPTFADLAAATVAGKEIFIAGYRITEGQARLSGKIYLDIQNDTA